MMRPERAPWSGELRSEPRVYMGAGTRRRLEESGEQRDEMSRVGQLGSSKVAPFRFRFRFGIGI